MFYMVVVCIHWSHCCCLVVKSCPTLQPMGCSLPDSSVHRISQGRILEWVSFPSSGDLSDLGIKPTISALVDGFSTAELSIQFNSVAQS